MRLKPCSIFWISLLAAASAAYFILPGAHQSLASYDDDDPPPPATPILTPTPLSEASTPPAGTPVPSIAPEFAVTPTPMPTPPAILEAQIVGPNEVVAHCAVIYTALITGGIPPYIQAWSGDYSGSFRSAGEQTLYCIVGDAVGQKATTELHILVHEFGCEVDNVNKEISEDESDYFRLTDDFNGYGPPPGIIIPVSTSKGEGRSATLSVSISAAIGAVSAKLGYSHGESTSKDASATYNIQLYEGQTAHLYAHPVYEISSGDVFCRNCELIYENGVFIGRNLSHWSVYLTVE